MLGIQFASQSRFTSFTEDGIEIVDAKGTPLRAQMRKTTQASASVPKAALAGTEGGKTALQMWKAFCRARGHEVPDDEVANA